MSDTTQKDTNMSMIEAAISRLESLAETCDQNATIEEREGAFQAADSNRRNAASYREAINRLRVSELPQDVPPAQPPQIPQRTPQIGDKVVYHPRPQDRIRKPENYNGLVSHTATVAHVYGDGLYNLCAIDSGGSPYPVWAMPFAKMTDENAEALSTGGWFEFSLDKEGN